MPSPAVALPEISISPAPPQELPCEPYSPFGASHPLNLKEPDSPRPALLSPPPTASLHMRRQLSPLRPEDAPVAGRGLERERFEALLRASRERNAAVGAKRSPDLRKEIAVKVHKSKQVERRALFLAKLQAPPSPSATMVPKTPPESPAIFHYSLPSPGLESPLAHFEMLALEHPDEDFSQVWVEQVDFRIPGYEYSKPAATKKRSFPLKKNALPSLEQITARLTPPGLSASRSPHSPRLPAFLRSPKKEEEPAPVQKEEKRRRALPSVGRLQLPSRCNAVEVPEIKIVSPVPRLPPASPSSYEPPKLQVTTTVVPRMSSRSPDALTESNLIAFAQASRERKAQHMLTRIRRRTVFPSQVSKDTLDVPVGRATDEEKKLRRHSAPPELQLKDRSGFCTPVLDIPGAF